MGSIPPEQALWDAARQQVIQDPFFAEAPQRVAKQRAANAHIEAVYPLWQQLNILREGDPKNIARMGKFIDATRRWSNRTQSTLRQLDKIVP